MDNKTIIGVDVGSVSTKAVLADTAGRIVDGVYIWTAGNPIAAVRQAVGQLIDKNPSVKIVGCGTTGSARKLAGAMLDADAVKNEITAHAAGTLSQFPDARTILEIGGQDSKIIFIEDGLVTDYAMNTLCAAGTGAFLTAQAARLGVGIEDFGTLALTATRTASIASRCAVFAESDLVHKAQIGYAKEEIIAGLCHAAAQNFCNNLIKGKKTAAPIIFQGGVSKNAGVARAFESLLGHKVLVHEQGHLMGALGAALLVKHLGVGKPFDPAILNRPFETRAAGCSKCGNNCELVDVYRDNSKIDTWGKRCG